MASLAAPDSTLREPTGRPAYLGHLFAVVVTLGAGLITGATWPFFFLAPFTPLFLAVYLSNLWGTRTSGHIATAVALAWAIWLAPNATHFTVIPISIFLSIALIATHLVSGRNEALDALRKSEARAIRALEETTAAEAKLRQAQKMEAVGQLVAGVAHNFNNLLTITMGYTDLLMDDAPEQARPHLTEIRHATQRGAKLTRQLLGITRTRDASLTHVDLNGALRELEALLIPVIREDIALSIRTSDAPAVAFLDPQDFDQIVLNLVLNARDALPDGGSIAIDVAVATASASDVPPTFTATAGEFVRVSVKDNGVGMTPDVQTHLFEPFFTTKEVDKGTGLGLAFTYGVVRNANGFVQVTTAPGAGTTVALYFPAANGIPAVASAPPPAPIVRHAPSGTILIVEDEAQVRSVAVRALRGVGYTVLDAGSPAEAMAIFEKEPRIELLLTDVVMPDMRGPDLAKHLLTLRPQLKVLLMSGYHEEAPGEGTTFTRLDKPFTGAELVGAVRTAFARAS